MSSIVMDRQPVVKTCKCGSGKYCPAHDNMAVRDSEECPVRIPHVNLHQRCGGGIRIVHKHIERD